MFKVGDKVVIDNLDEGFSDRLEMRWQVEQTVLTIIDINTSVGSSYSIKVRDADGYEATCFTSWLKYWAGHKKRPEHVKCIRKNDDTNKTWCGLLHEEQFVFLDIDHAVFNKINEGRLVTCNNCSQKIINELE